MVDYEKINWNDLKAFLAVARHGRYSHAAKSLQTTHVTVANTIKRLEKSISKRLFVQSKNGFHLTKEGKKLLPIAEECERQLMPVAALATLPKVRVGTTEGFGNSYLSKRISRWLLTNNIDLEFVTLPKHSKISRREADICITIEPPNNQQTIKQVLTPYGLGIYASEEYLSKHPIIKTRKDLVNHKWIGYVEDHIFSSTLEYHKEISENLDFVFRSTALVNQITAAIEGIGLSILPHYSATNPNLIRVLPEIEFRRTYWISASKDIQRFKFMLSVWLFIKEACKMDRELFRPGETSKAKSELSKPLDHE